MTPTFASAVGRAWRLDHRTIIKEMGLDPDQDGTVGAWVVHAPNSHPIWPWYRVVLVHLRSTPNLPEPKIRKPGATHEFIIEALNPDHTPKGYDDWPSDTKFPEYYLSPPNFVAQLVCESDMAARGEVEERVVGRIVDGVLDPDTDYIRIWIAHFGDDGIKKGF